MPQPVDKLKVPLFASLGFRLTAVVSAVVLSVVAISSVATAWSGFGREVESQRATLAAAGSAYAAAISKSVEENDRASVAVVMRGVTNLPGVVQADVRKPDGTSLTQLGGGALLLGRDGDPETMSDWQIWNAKQLRVEVPIRQNGRVVGELGLLADISDLQTDIVRDLQWTLLSALVLLAIGLGVAWALISRLTRPLSRLTAEMASIATDPGSDTSPVKAGHDETGVLAETFNQMMLAIRDRDQRITRHVDTLEDTVEDRTRDLRLARDAAEQANAAKSDFLATMSHEIRTPMNGLMVMAEMLAASELPVRQRRYADIISRSGGSLLTIINDILDLSKIESGKLDLEQIPVSPEQLALDAASLFWEKAREKGLVLTVCVSPRVPEQVIADPTRLNQVITNLVNNALKFTETGGATVLVDAKSSETDAAVRLSIAVQDTGVGISNDKLPHIFEAFSQADQTTTRRFGGTGLGLTVCKRLVTAMNGVIRVASEEGKGSVFRIDIPVQVERPAMAVKNTGLPVWIESDSPLQSRALSYGMKAHGCSIAKRPAEAAFRIVPSHRAASSSSDLPTVILSDVGDMYADRVIAEDRASDMLNLPFSRRELADLIDRASRGQFRGAVSMNAVTSAQTLPDVSGLHILAVDDNAVNREVLREALASLGVSADFAENGEEALNAAALGAYDLVLMDGSMPVMDGFEATRQLKQREHEAGAPRCPVIALTAQVAGTTRDHWTAAGADGYVSKPFTIERLAYALAGNAPQEALDRAAQETAVDEKGAGIFDPDTLFQFETLGGASKTRVRDTVWTLFVDRGPVGFAELRRAVNADVGFAEVARLAHALKSMALSAGLARLAETCGRLETLAKTDASPTDLSDLVAEVEIALLATLSEMERLMSSDDQQVIASARA
ncbi:MAG: ATP-binding protein [Pseudomonadota bacterium]